MSEPALLRRLRAGREVEGQRLGDYELLEVLARGGQGFVLEGRHRELELRVALKVFDPQGSAASPERFREEARVLARLRHPNLPRVLHLGEEQGVLYAALDLVEGPTLEEVLDEGLPEPEWSARAAAEVADALAHVHARGLVHRDVKPPNVVLEGEAPGARRAVLVDFGLVKRDPNASAFASLEALQLSQSNEVKGSPEFMAPEQADPERAPLGPAADLFGLGATLYFLLTGRPPFRGESTTELLREVLRATPASPRSVNRAVPPWLDALCMQALAKEADERPSSARAFAEALRAGLRGEQRPQSSAASAAEPDDASGTESDLEEVVELGEPSSAGAAESGERPRRGSGRRKRPAPRSSRVAGAISLDSAEELPAYRPPPRRASGRRAALGGPAGGALSPNAPAWAIGVGIVLVFVAAGLVTGQLGPGPGLTVFAAGVLPLAASFALWRRVERPRRAPARRLRGSAEASAALQRAREALASGDPAAALTAANEALRHRPEDPEALALRGTARVRRGEVAKGVLDLDAALELDPRHWGAYAERGAVRYRLGDLLGAIDDFDQLVLLRPEDPEAFANRGACHYKVKDYPRALHDFDRCLELAPEDPEARRRRGRVRFKARDFAGAAADWSAVLALRPDDHDALRKRAVAYRRLGDEARARADEARLSALEGAS